jgi:hypothetical protein
MSRIVVLARPSDFPIYRRATGVVLCVVALVFTQACFGPSAGAVADYVTGARVVGQNTPGVMREGSLAPGAADGPVITEPPAATVVNGGSLQVPVTANAAFKKVLVAVQTDDGPATGYYEVDTATSGTSAQLVLSLAQSLPGDSFRLSYAVIDERGRQGVPSQQAVDTVEVSTGQVQVSVSWDVTSDVDLHVIDPNGAEIFYGDSESSSGGTLDLDSNRQCAIDHVNNENVSWSDAPVGTYTVRLDYWANCGAANTSYVVTVHAPGQSGQVFSGNLTGEGDQGEAGSGVFITTFAVDAAAKAALPTPRPAWLTPVLVAAGVAGAAALAVVAVIVTAVVLRRRARARKWVRPATAGEVTVHPQPGPVEAPEVKTPEPAGISVGIYPRIELGEPVVREEPR